MLTSEPETLLLPGYELMKQFIEQLVVLLEHRKTITEQLEVLKDQASEMQSTISDLIDKINHRADEPVVFKTKDGQHYCIYNDQSMGAQMCNVEVHKV